MHGSLQIVNTTFNLSSSSWLNATRIIVACMYSLVVMSVCPAESQHYVAFHPQLLQCSKVGESQMTCFICLLFCLTWAIFRRCVHICHFLRSECRPVVVFYPLPTSPEHSQPRSIPTKPKHQNTGREQGSADTVTPTHI